MQVYPTECWVAIADLLPDLSTPHGFWQGTVLNKVILYQKIIPNYIYGAIDGSNG